MRNLRKDRHFICHYCRLNPFHWLENKFLSHKLYYSLFLQKEFFMVLLWMLCSNFLVALSTYHSNGAPEKYCKNKMHLNPKKFTKPLVAHDIDAYSAPFTLWKNLIIVLGHVDGKEGWLILDTGTQELILNQNYFKGDKTQSGLSGIAGSQENTERKTSTVEIGNLPKYNQYAFISNLTEIEKYLELEILGLCGTKYLKKYQWDIHYHEKRIDFYPIDKSGEILFEKNIPNERTLKLQEDQGLLLLSATIEGFPSTLILDTGVNSTILDKRFESLTVLSFEKEKKQKKAIGINGTRQNIETSIISKILIGEVNIPPVQVFYLCLKSVNKGRRIHFDGTFNPVFLCHGTVGINWVKKELYLSKPVIIRKRSETALVD